MSEFIVPLDSYEVARQVADMINCYNRWYTTFSPHTILSADARYLVEMCLDRVVGCAAIVKESDRLSKIQHVCVLPDFRRRGIAKKLVNWAVLECGTEFVCMTVREDNVASLAMARSLGFEFINKIWFRDHYTLLMARPKDYNGRQYLGNAKC